MPRIGRLYEIVKKDTQAHKEKYGMFNRGSLLQVNDIGICIEDGGLQNKFLTRLGPVWIDVQRMSRIWLSDQRTMEDYVDV